ncbi:MAG: UDP-N-acetylglucosamine 2-epimerase (non-hydrolyzing) [Candidatus Omnitrophica bacterium]|nr:UDP-N-acetylglucosamine 2-epimerase (non-hydrolyzing) [Candidatus Omnitrophota bacterium]
MLRKKRYLKVVHVVGARPNFVKIAPLIREMRKYKRVEQLLVHTGQHYDFDMSSTFFKDFKIPKPDINLGVGSLGTVRQIAEIKKRFEKVCLEKKPDIIIVVGDVNSTLACSLVANKLNIKLAHIEAGLRSFDRTMPEETNRMVTDSLSDYLFTTCNDANLNLVREGIDKKKIHFVGNVMIDSLLLNLKKISSIKFNLKPKSYAVLTLHRPSNVDNKNNFLKIIKILQYISLRRPIIFPAHPRTLKQIQKFKFFNYFFKCKFSSLDDNLLRKHNYKGIFLVEPLAYLNFLKLYSCAHFVLTDSGGIQEETTFLNIPCITLRENTERPITIKKGTNYLTCNNFKKNKEIVDIILQGRAKISKKIKFWDGNASKRIVSILISLLHVDK